MLARYTCGRSVLPVVSLSILVSSLYRPPIYLFFPSRFNSGTKGSPRDSISRRHSRRFTSCFYYYTCALSRALTRKGTLFARVHSRFRALHTFICRYDCMQFVYIYVQIRKMRIDSVYSSIQSHVARIYVYICICVHIHICWVGCIHISEAPMHGRVLSRRVQ